MSSILKALKKVEEEGHKHPDGDSRFHPVTSKKSSFKRDQKSRMILFTLLCIFAAAVISISSWAIFKKETVQPPLIAHSENIFIPAGSNHISEVNKKLQQEDKKSGITTKVEVPSDPILSMNREIDKEMILPPPAPHHPISQEEDIESHSIEDDTGQPNIVEEKSIMEEEMIGEEETIDIEEIPAEFTNYEKSVIKRFKPPSKVADESWLKLQAISWSNDPESRIAMINDRIVHEGGSVEDGVVTRIDKEYVVVHGKGEDWQVQFKINQGE